MKKENVYFLVKPNTFWRYGEVDINGNYPEYLLGNFDVNREYNFFMFEGKCNNDYYPDTVKEIFTGKKFNLTIYEDDMATIESDELGLYFNGVRNIKDIEIVPSKASGLL